MLSLASTLCALLPTDGQRENQQMVDTPDFAERWKQALAMNGTDNAAVARALDPESGQQLVNTWKRRKKVGSTSVPLVMELLPRTNMEWLQYGVGRPERFSGVNEPSPNYAAGNSQVLRPDPAILLTAYSYAHYGLGMYSEDKELDLTQLPDCICLADIYALLFRGNGVLPGGENSSELKAVIEQRTQRTGGSNGGESSRDAAVPAGKRKQR